jgi:hypothetical protein
MSKEAEVVRLPTPKATGNMRLANVTSGKLAETFRIFIAGVEGIGKSSFAAAAPKPIFIDVEGSTGQLDVQRYPGVQNFADVLDAVNDLTVSQHDFKTVAIDTVDWLEALIWQHVCARDRQFTIEDYGYGKGYTVALDEWRRLLVALERLERAKGMNIILVGHSHIRPFKNPEGEDFDRYEVKLHTKAAGLLKEWARAVLFAHYEQYAVKTRGALKAKGVASGTRLIHTERSAAYDAKNRYGLPPTLPLSWQAFEAAANTVKTPEQISADILALVAGKDAAIEAAVAQHLAAAGADVPKLNQLKNWTAQKLAFLAEQQSQSNPNTQSKES